jgi:hypothetical protein
MAEAQNYQMAASFALGDLKTDIKEIAIAGV